MDTIISFMITVNQQHIEDFTYSQEEVIAFAKVSGDSNPIHLDAEYAAATPFKKPIMHGMIGASVISRVFGMTFPGEGTIYMGQTVAFKRPMYAGTEYQAVVTAKELNHDKHTGIFTTEVIDKTTGKVCISGEATVMNKKRI